MGFNRYIFLLSLFITILYGQENIVKNYNINDGLVQSTVRSICKDSTGYIWFGTDNGLSRFDGKRFRNFIEPKELFENSILKIGQLNSTNLILLNDKNELWMFNGNSFKKLPGLKNNTSEINDVLILGENKILLGTKSNGVFYLSEKDTLHHTEINGLFSNQIVQLSKDKLGNVFIITKNGVNTFSENKIHKLFPNEQIEFLSVMQYSDGSYWAIDKKNGYYQLENGKWEKHLDIRNMTYGTLIEDNLKRIWSVNNWGLFKIIKNSYGEIYPFQEIPSFNSLCMLNDNYGNVWCGALGKGVYRVSKNLFYNFDRNQEFPSFYGKALLTDSNGDSWIAAYGYGLVKVNPFGSKHFPASEGLPHNYVTSGIEISKNEILFSTNNGFAFYKNGKFFPFSEKGLPEKRITSLVKSENNIYAATSSKGVFRFKDGEWKKVLLSGLEDGVRINYLYKDSKSEIWIATRSQGLFSLSGKKITKSDGLVSNDINTICEDHLGQLWIGNKGGLNVLKENKIIKTYSRESGLLSSSVYALSKFDDKMLIGTSDGIAIFADDKFEFLTTADGLSTNDMNTPKFLIDDYGKVWIGNTAGLSVFFINNYFSRNKNSSFVMQKIVTDEETIEINPFVNSFDFGEHVFKSSMDFIRFEFVPITYASDKFNYRYKVIRNQTEDEWIYSDVAQTIIEDCESGKYQVLLQAKTFGNNWFDVKEMSFEIEPPFYNSAWFLITVFIAVLTSSWLLKIKIDLEKRKKKYQTTKLTKNKKQEIKCKIEELVVNQKKYIDPTLTLHKVSIELGYPKEQVSQVINSEFKQNYNEFINNFRIDEAKKMLDKNGELNYSILQIAYEVGFNSKSSFNSVFKKTTGKTPTEYKKMVAERHND